MLDVIGVVLMLLVIAFIIAVIFIVMEMNDLKRKVDGFYDPYNDMFSKVNGLYKLDFHKTERPKIDIFMDNIGESQESIWREINILREKIGELQKKDDIEKLAKEEYKK